MGNLQKLFRRFHSDERGVFAVIFGVAAIVLVALSGSVVDFVTVQNAKSLAQSSLDSAALALQPTIYTKTEAQIKGLAQELIEERMTIGGVTIDMEDADLNTTTGRLLLKARINVPLSFLGLVGISEMNVRIASQAVRKQLFLEVGMVLDNSGSMNGTRMSNLKTAAANATNILFDGDAVSATTKMGIVPFTSFVNIGTANAAASWLDVAGNSSIASDNFDNDDNNATLFNGPVNRLALYNQMNNVSWGGCVDARPHTQTGPNSHLDTNDTLPTSATPDTLIVPSFAPDTPDDWAAWQGNYKSDSTGTAACPWLPNWVPGRIKQERLCKYNGNISTGSWGPNFDCPSAPTLPLSNTRQTVLDAISAMSAGGATNIHMGTIWGFRLLSPTAPFSEGRPYDPDTAKALIIMTDGQNTMYPSNNMNGASYYSPYGYPVNGRIGALGWSQNQLITEMNVRTLESCTNAKAAGITVYTIGLNPPNNATRTMLTQCATGASHAFFPSNPSDLDDVFRQIANKLSALRLSL